MRQIIEIEALDTLFFRDGKPFTMGQDTVGESIFPPHPSTCLLYTSPSPRDRQKSRMPSSA